MFADRRSRAAAKKDLDALQVLHRQCSDDASALFAWALAQPSRRVVVKRPLKGASLPGCKPSHALRGKAIRFDVYVRSGGECTAAN